MDRYEVPEKEAWSAGMVSDSDAWVGWVVTGTRGLKCRNGAGKRDLESRTDKLHLRKGTESDDWSAERGPNNEEWIGRKSIEKRGLDCWYGIGKRCLGQKDVYEKARIGMPEWCRQARLGVQEGRVSFKKRVVFSVAMLSPSRWRPSQSRTC